MYSLIVYVPEAYCEAVKAALFTAGAGRIGAYDQGCWQVVGQGQFRPLAGSTPFSGTPGELTVVPEVRLEMICENHAIDAVITALKEAHPYEMPPYHYVEIRT